MDKVETAERRNTRTRRKKLKRLHLRTRFTLFAIRVGKGRGKKKNKIYDLREKFTLLKKTLTFFHELNFFPIFSFFFFSPQLVNRTTRSLAGEIIGQRLQRSNAPPLNFPYKYLTGVCDTLKHARTRAFS